MGGNVLLSFTENKSDAASADKLQNKTLKKKKKKAHLTLELQTASVPWLGAEVQALPLPLPRLPVPSLPQ